MDDHLPDETGHSRLHSSMQLWIFGMLVEHDMLTKVPKRFPTRDDGDLVSHLLRKSQINLMINHNASVIKNFGVKRLGNVMTGQDFFRKMQIYCRENALKEGYIPL